MSGQVSVDILAPQKSFIDLSDRQLPTDFGLNDYELSKLFDDVMLLEYVDLVGAESGAEYIERNGIIIPVSQVQNLWRKGKVILKGPNVRFTEVGDIVVFPNNMGIPIKNLEVTDHGKIRDGLFLNEQRMFGICKLKDKSISEEG